MKLLLLSGNFPQYDDTKIVNNSKKGVQFAANTFQWNLIKGFRKLLKNNFYILSAPFINSYPNGYKKIMYYGKKISKNENYISFVNLFGLRNISRFIHLKRNVKDFLKINDNEKYVIVYSPHVPLLKTACYLKRKDPRINIILLLPDLPQFVTLTDNTSLIYKLLKPLDIKSFYKYSKLFDKYILLTDQMNEIVNQCKKPSLVVEGIVDDLKTSKKTPNNKKIVTYTGTLDKKYGICHLLDAFMMIKNKNYILKICGRGDSEEYINNCIKKDSRILFLGQLSAKESKRIQNESNVLINPRQNIGEFTKYSFPSKNLEYLTVGIPVIAYKLDGIPNEYDNILFYPKNNSVEMLKNEIERCASFKSEELVKYQLKTSDFLKRKNIEYTTSKILKFIKKK